MRNWKTSLAGAISAVGVLAPAFGVPVNVGEAVVVLGLFLLGLFSKDFNISGGKK